MNLFTLPLINANRQGVTPGRVGLPDEGINVYKRRSEIKERRSWANVANPGKTQLPEAIFRERGFRRASRNTRRMAPPVRLVMNLGT